MAVEIVKLEGAEQLSILAAPIPFPDTAVAFVAIEDSHVVGYAVYQHLPHCDPEWVSPDHRGTGLAGRLAEAVTTYAAAQGAFLVIADNAHAEVLCREHGLEHLEGSKVFLGRSRRPEA